MAALLKRLFLTFLLVLAISSHNVLARERQAFSKFVRSETPTESVVIPEESPAVQVAKAAKFRKDFPTAAASTTDNNKHAYSYSTNGDGASYNPDAIPSRFADNELYSKDANYDNKGYSNEEHQRYSYSTNGGGYRNKASPVTYNPVNHAYNNEGYGMSDTRTLENGKYLYDVKSGKGYGAYAGIGVEGNQNNQEDQDEEYDP